MAVSRAEQDRKVQEEGGRKKYFRLAAGGSLSSHMFIITSKYQLLVNQSLRNQKFYGKDRASKGRVNGATTR